MKNIELANIIKQAREKKEISQRELARRIKVDNAEISRIEKGTRKQPNFFILQNLSKELNLDFKQLMEASKYEEEVIEYLLPYKDKEIKEYPNREWTEEEYHEWLNTRESGVDLLKVIRDFGRGKISESDFIYLISKCLGVDIRDYFK